MSLEQLNSNILWSATTFTLRTLILEDKNAFQEKGHIKLDHSTSVSIAPATSEGIPIQIINAKRTFIMTFPTREEAEQWSKKINEAVAHSSS